MIPFILGLSASSSSLIKTLSVAATLMFFILTGVALVIYLNSPPVEPRERDYIYAGSYYVFAIWIGLSVLAIGQMIAKMRTGTNCNCHGCIIPYSCSAKLGRS